MRKVAVLTGPTAVGKTYYSLGLALALNGEIVSCDSMQIYKHMDIGSAKPSKEELKLVKHHLIDVVNPKDRFSVAKYQTLAKAAIHDILERGKLPIITGGTGLYLNSLLYDMEFGPIPTNEKFRKELFLFLEEEGKDALHDRLAKVDSASAARIHPNNTKRVIRALEAVEVGEEPLRDFGEVKAKTEEFDFILMGLTMDRVKLYDRINRRVDVLMEMGLADEVRKLLDMGLTEDDTSMKGIGYKELIDYYLGRCDLGEAVDKIKQNTRKYAKRQTTWFKKYEDMKWFDPDQYEGEGDALAAIEEWVKIKK